jgi:ABC-type transport system involved in multi-copper enzyme maturation permease subunit
MNLLPVAHRELLVLSRRSKLYWLRSGIGLVIACLSVAIMTVQILRGAPPSELSRPLFTALAYLCYFISLISGPVLLADCLAGERRAGTLGFLFQTDLGALDIVAGKFVALAMPALHGLLAALPVMAVTFFMGGVTGGELVRTGLALANLLFFSLAMTLLCSAVARHERTAFAVSGCIMAGCGAVLPALDRWLDSGRTASLFLMDLFSSPGLPVWLAGDAAYGTDAAAFSQSLILSHCAGWLCLAAACLVLPFTWQVRSGREAQCGGLAGGFRARPVGNRDPMLWLALHQLGRPLIPWCLAAIIALLVLLGISKADGTTDNAILIGVAVYVLHSFYKLPVAWCATRAFSRERDSGALEMLFVTPAGETAAWRGWMAGMRRRFLLPGLALVAVDLLLSGRTLVVDSPGFGGVKWYFLTVIAAGMFLLDCYVLSWVGLWQGLTARNATRACIRTLMSLMILPGIAFTPLLVPIFSNNSLDEEAGIVIGILWFLASFLMDVGVGVWSMVHLSDDCREIAARSARNS